MEFLQSISSQTLVQWSAILIPNQRIHILYLLSAFVLAFVSYLSLRALEANKRPDNVQQSFLKYVFDVRVYMHRSSIQDYKYFLINGFIYYGILTQLLIGMPTFSNLFIELLESGLGPMTTPLFEVTPFWVVCYTLVAVLTFDFAVYLLHYLHHRFSFFWEFHKVHHSAEELNPMTLFRMHPVDLFLTGLGVTVLSAFAYALFFYMSGKELSPYTLLNLNVVVFAFYIMGYNLRHSHIWLNYPTWLSYVFISPAQHQIHHSRDPIHFDKNLGLIFSFWDYLFGTLYIPRRYEKLSFGLNEHEPNPYDSVVDLYVVPIRNAFHMVFAHAGRKIVSLSAFAATIFFATYISLFVWERYVLASQLKLSSLRLEDLTWTEIAHAQKNGFDTILIPTGGTEQNGPHVILGKHNYIIRMTSDKVAEIIGKTLVAPVMAYVPEGHISPEPTGHMRFPGTVSLPESLFEHVLGAAVESYIAHGFKNILIMGDSGDSMKAQDRLASRIHDEHKMLGIRVFHISDYYKKNGQFAWLKTRGFKVSDIGLHAGIRDTSELLAVHPNGVRERPLHMKILGSTGASGRAEFASEKLGQAMLNLKIQAAVKQIRRVMDFKEAQGKAAQYPEN
ncbi:MAG: creatininase family protein [Methyloligellaceae bacterium]